MKLAVDRHEGPNDRHSATLDVEVGPGEAQRLTAPTAGQREKAPKGDGSTRCCDSSDRAQDCTR